MARAIERRDLLGFVAAVVYRGVHPMGYLPGLCATVVVAMFQAGER